jgi:hypothetical protein
MVVKIFLAKCSAVEIIHPPRSPGLAPSEFFSLCYSENCLKRKRFQDVEDFKKNVTAELFE